jgi:hypothetical protein
MLALASCDKEGCTQESASNYNPDATEDDGSCILPSYEIVNVTIDGVNYRQVSGTIDENVTFDVANNYLLTGGVFVASGATLTIESCTNVYAQTSGATTFLSVLKGGTLNAVGTASCPIVFTPLGSNAQAGDWGGIIVNGNAPINTGTEAQGEGGTGFYGGTNPNDNSGIIQYVRVEYAGKILGTDSELNGFSFNGVGSGTTVDHIQAYRGSDDGIEFFGGTVSVNYAVSTGNQDDSFDWTHGFSGTCSNWVVVQDPANGDRGIEADNNGDDNSVAPYSNPTITNIHMTLRDSSVQLSGIKLREGTKGSLSNIEITGSLKAIDIQHDQTLDNVIAGDLTVSGVTVTGSLTNPSFKSSTSDATLEGNAASSGNVTIDGTGNVSTTWLNEGNWVKAL